MVTDDDLKVIAEIEQLAKLLPPDMQRQLLNAKYSNVYQWREMYREAVNRWEMKVNSMLAQLDRIIEHGDMKK